MDMMTLLYMGGKVVQGIDPSVLVDKLQADNDMLWLVIKSMGAAISAVVFASFAYIKKLHSRIEKSEARRAEFAERFLRIRQVHPDGSGDIGGADNSGKEE